jgi:hypothetical protein
VRAFKAVVTVPALRQDADQMLGFKARQMHARSRGANLGHRSQFGTGARMPVHQAAQHACSRGLGYGGGDARDRGIGQFSVHSLIVIEVKIHRQGHYAGMEPKDPIDAVTHRDPYPYYARLLAGPQLHFDAGLGLWIAARVAVVSEVLASPACRVRPATEPVPAAISGSTAGAVFGHLVRMNDGARHDGPKRALERALASLSAADVYMRARRIARLGLPTTTGFRTLSAWVFDTPVSVVADLLGFAEEEWPMVAAWTREFVACMSTLSTPEQVTAASAAASLLRSRMQCLLRAASAHNGSLLEQVRVHAHAEGWADGTAIIANLIGLLSQTCEATAGLIGNAIVALAADRRRASQGGRMGSTGTRDQPIRLAGPKHAPVRGRKDSHRRNRTGAGFHDTARSGRCQPRSERQLLPT